MVKGWCIISAISGHRHHLSSLLQHVYQALLVGRTSATHHLEHSHTLIGLFIAESLKLLPGNLGTIGHLFIPYTYLACYLYGCGRSIAGNHFYFYSSTMAFAHCHGHLFSQRITNGCHGLEGEQFPTLADIINHSSSILIVSIGIGEGKSAHSLSLASI